MSKRTSFIQANQISMEAKYINRARDYAKAHNNLGILTFLSTNDDYKQIKAFDKKHYFKTIKRFFKDDVDMDTLMLFVETKG